MILGMPWHKTHNPKIDYSGNTITFDPKYYHLNCYCYSKTVLLDPRDKPEIKMSREIELREPETRTPEPDIQTLKETEL